MSFVFSHRVPFFLPFSSLLSPGAGDPVLGGIRLPSCLARGRYFCVAVLGGGDCGDWDGMG